MVITGSGNATAERAPALQDRQRAVVEGGCFVIYPLLMAEDRPSLQIDDDWKKQAQEEKRRLAEREQKAAPAPATAPPPGAGAAPAGVEPPAPAGAGGAPRGRTAAGRR